MDIFIDEKNLQLIYTVIFFVVAIFFSLFSNRKKPKKDDRTDRNEYYQDNNYRQNQTDMPYKAGGKKGDNPIFTSSTNNISYSRTIKIFFIIALISVLITAYFTGMLDDFIFEILYLLNM